MSSSSQENISYQSTRLPARNTPGGRRRGERIEHHHRIKNAGMLDEMRASLALLTHMANGENHEGSFYSKIEESVDEYNNCIGQMFRTVLDGGLNRHILSPVRMSQKIATLSQSLGEFLALAKQPKTPKTELLAKLEAITSYFLMQFLLKNDYFSESIFFTNYSNQYYEVVKILQMWRIKLT